MKKSAWRFLFTTVSLILFTSGLYSQSEKNTRVEIKTTQGDIIVELYNETPLHRDNFIKLVESGFYSGSLFHRTIKDYIIQGGDPESKNAEDGALLGNGGPDYKIPAEFSPSLFHKRGALAAARQPDSVNPEKESNGSQFYFVLGRKYLEKDLTQLAQRREQEMKNQCFNDILNDPANADFKKRIEMLSKVNNQPELNFFMQSLQPKVQELYEQRGGASYTPEQIKAYEAVGGNPNLDGNYTVFGEVISGMEVVEKIAAMETDARNRPVENIEMKKLKVLK